MGIHKDTTDIRFFCTRSQKDAIKRHGRNTDREMNSVIRRALALYALAENDTELLAAFTYDDATETDDRVRQYAVNKTVFVSETVLPMCERLGFEAPQNAEAGC